MDLTALHTVVGRAFIIFSLLVALLALYKYLRKEPLGGDFWGAVVIGEGVAVAQLIIGIILLIMGRSPARVIHFLYGALVVLAWPATFGYTRTQESGREALTWALVSAFLFGLALRAFGTGGG
jgi:FtsH-binding integral membrane protein